MNVLAVGRRVLRLVVESILAAKYIARLCLEAVGKESCTAVAEQPEHPNIILRENK